MEEMKQTTAEATEAAEETKQPAASKAEKNDKKKQKKLEAEIAELQKQLEDKEEAVRSSEDKYMRMMAEYDNFRKRSAKEREGVYADAYADCIANILPILDNLERASKSDNL